LQERSIGVSRLSLPDRSAATWPNCWGSAKTSEKEQLMTSERTTTETIQDTGGVILDRVKDLVQEGNVRRIIIKHEGKSIAEFPVTAAVVGVVLAPMLAAIGALTAVLTHCTIEVHRVEQAAPPPTSGSTTA
jgi:hypothetical protein